MTSRSEVSRRAVTRMGVLGAPAALLGARAGGSTTTAPTAPPATAPPTSVPPAPSPFVKPVPPEWFNVLGTNAEMRWDAADFGHHVPNERFFVRNHTSTPRIDARTWRLAVFGSGLRDAPDAGHAVTFTYDQLRRMPSRTVSTAIECAGNGRRFYDAQQGQTVSGTAWSLGAVGVARWTGVPLRDVLRRAGITAAAVDVLPEGLDAPVVANGVDQGHVRRPLPVAKALDDALLAYAMNGEMLPPDHGFPLRLVVPGWIGIASIKWLGRIEVADHALFSPWNTTQYRLVGGDHPADSPPITDQVVKSAFELPFPATAVAGRRTVLHGRSWSGTSAIRSVEVSTDGGATWRRAELFGPNRPEAWLRWSLPWRPTTATTELRARATDRDGRTQPDVSPFNSAGYLFGAVVRHPVTVT
jgi:DMSO/TMAO reductase YedYZ molybdopterin-dependent catalytic subunit